MRFLFGLFIFFLVTGVFASFMGAYALIPGLIAGCYAGSG